MNLLPADSASTFKTAANGISYALLQTPNMISTAGVVLGIGSRNGDESGQTFLTIQAKVLDAIGSPKDAFKNGVTTTVNVQRDYSVVMFSYLPETTKQARTMLDVLLSPTSPRPESINAAKAHLDAAEELGNVTPDNLFEGIAVSASFQEKSFSRDPLLGDAKTVSSAVLNSLSSEALLFGTSDQESSLSGLAGALRSNQKIIKPPAPVFAPGFSRRDPSGAMFKGTKLVRDPTLQKVSITVPAPSYRDADFLTYKVIQKLFGGGTYFSSDGLGVGSNSILYEQVLSKSGSCESVFGYYFPFQDAGLLSFGFAASEKELSTIVKRVRHSVNLATKVTPSDVEAAKSQAIVGMLKQLDFVNQRMQEFGVQAKSYGKSIAVADVVDAMRKISREDVIRCAKKIQEQTPSVGVIGNADPEKIFENWN